MQIFVAGASGVIGLRVVPLLLAAGHTVAGMTRTPEKAERLRVLGAEPVVCDVFDRDALCSAVAAYRPDVVLHELTDLPDDPTRILELGAANSRMRRQGTGNLLAAATAAGASLFLAQSVAWQLPGDAGAAVEEHERAVLEVGGVVLRYGRLYGPGTYFESELPPPPRVHVEEAARRTVIALQAPSGVITVAEDGSGSDRAALGPVPDLD
ncbi:MAG: NAD-dependent epimerase/dehydratase family protein [Candidatus Dormibacteria bacterium]